MFQPTLVINLNFESKPVCSILINEISLHLSMMQTLLHIFQSKTACPQKLNWPIMSTAKDKYFPLSSTLSG